MMLAAVMLISLTSVKAQPYSDVIVTYEIEFDSDEMDAMSASMLEGSTMTLMFKGQKVRLEMDMNIMSTTAITDEAGKTGIVLMDMFGQKMYQTIDEEGLDGEEGEEDFSVEYTGETMEIAGMTTEQAIVTYDDGREAEFWICKDIVPNSNSSDFTMSGIKGLPLQMDMQQDNMAMHLIAVDVVLEAADDELFDTTPPAGYTEMDDN